MRDRLVRWKALLLLVLLLGQGVAVGAHTLSSHHLHHILSLESGDDAVVVDHELCILHEYTSHSFEAADVAPLFAEPCFCNAQLHVDEVRVFDSSTTRLPALRAPPHLVYC
ncbi:MAG: hypothetical protein Q4D93_04030 [Porphyromonas sp.]|nr:hypothetical protein [Porphyromonas sp.]